MKKFVLIAAAAAAISAATAVTPANAGFKGCCGGWNPSGNFHHHWGGGFGGGISVGLVGLDSGYGGDCYYVRRAVLVPGIGLVSKRQLVCG